MGQGFVKTESILTLSSLDTPARKSLEDQIARLFDEWHDPLFRYLFLLSWDSAEAEDLAQEAFLRLHQHIRAGQSIDNVKAWLFRVGHNLFIDRGRRTRVTDSLSQPEVTRAAEDVHARTMATPEERLAERERRRRLALAVEALPSQQRHCLYLRREGFRYREIAVVLGIRESTVIDHLRRAIGRLSKELHDVR